MKTLKYIALAALTISFAACTQDEDFIPQGDTDAVKISATIGKLQTRVSYDDEGNTTFDTGDFIQVENTKRTTKNKATYTYDGSSWSTTESLVWNGSSTNQFEAWYPAYENASYDSFKLPTDQSSDALLTAADWMTATTGEIATKPDNNTINLTFKHQLTKVTVNVTTWNSEFSENNKTITDPIIWSTGSYIEISYGTGTDGADEYTSDGSPTAINPVVSGETFTAIVAPVKYDALTRFMTFTVDGQDLTVLTKNGILTDGLEAGKHYTFNLTVGKEVAYISSVNITHWDEKEINGGVAEGVVTQ